MNFPFWIVPSSVNHRFPSGPAVMPPRPLLAVGTINSLMVPRAGLVGVVAGVLPPEFLPNKPSDPLQASLSPSRPPLTNTNTSTPTSSHLPQGCFALGCAGRGAGGAAGP